MIIEADLERLLIVSDLHVGNPFSQASRRFGRFLEHAGRQRFNVCINGDGLEILQTSFANLANDTVRIIDRIRRLVDAGLRVYYVVGNHDIVLEHYLESWNELRICPFLNVRSGDRLIRVEHGHLYDPFYVKHPALYDTLTRAAGPLLHIYPDVYRVWSSYQQLKDRFQRNRQDDSGSVYHEAARLLFRRGFDAVVFGHTHKAEFTELEADKLYVNSGNWMRGCPYVRLDQGRLSLEHFDIT
ncbi:MAG: UDP-2,3-diacylglucosamine diphosphatase [Polyangiaceae bacterium]